MSKASREFKRKTELRRTMTMLKRQIELLERQKKDYLERAKSARLKGNAQMYNVSRSMLKSLIGQTRRLELMQMNLEFAIGQRDFVEHNRSFVKGMSSLGKSLLKSIKMIDIGKTMQILDKSMSKVNESLQGLDGLLDNNEVLFDSVAGGEVPDSELDSLIGNEALSAERGIDDEIDRMLGITSQQKVSAPPLRANAETATQSSLYSLDSAPRRKPDEDGEDRSNFKAAGSNGLPEADLQSREESRKPVANEPRYAESARGNRRESGVNAKGFEVRGAALRPQRLQDYMGQPKAIAALEDPIRKSMLTGEPLKHVLLCGSYGQGKTTLAKIIANEVGGNFYEVSAQVRYRDMLRILKQLKPGDVVFIDEVHRLTNDVVETLLYPAMEEYKLNYAEGNGARTRTISQDIAPFTFVGATTESGKLLRPFYSKFPIKITLAEYELSVIAAIVSNSFRALGLQIAPGPAEDIARRSRLSPRTANSFVEGIASSAVVKEAARRGITAKGALADRNAIEQLNISVQAEDVRSYFIKKGIDEIGMSDEDRMVLNSLIKLYSGGPVGVDNLAKSINVEPNRLTREYEPYLVKCGFINVRPQGRFATDQAYRYLGIPKNASDDSSAETEDANKTLSSTEPAAAFGSGASAASAQPQDNSPDEDELPVLECTTGEKNEKAAARFEDLFAGAGRVFDEPLDKLFPDVDKDYDSAAVNQCILRVNGVRELYCDSKLERRFLSYLFRNGFITDAKSEALELEYASAETAGKIYYPDFVMRLYDGRVAVVELKNMAAIGYHLNVDKYEALARWCAERGYLYAEIAKDYEENRYTSAERIKSGFFNEALHRFILDCIAERGKCTADDLDEYRYNLCDLLCILLNDRTLKNIDRTGNGPVIVAAK